MNSTIYKLNTKEPHTLGLTLLSAYVFGAEASFIGIHLLGISLAAYGLFQKAKN